MSDGDARPTLSAGEGDLGEGERDPLLDLLEEGVCRLDAGGELVALNDAFVDLLGYDRGDLLGEDLRSFVVPADRPRLSAVLGWYDSPDADGVRFDAVRVRFETADGTRSDRELRLDASRPSAPGETVAVVRDPAAGDVTADATPDLSGLLADPSCVTYRCPAPDGPPRFVGGACRDVTGYDAAMLESGAVGWRDDVVHPDDRGRVREAVRAGLSSRGRFHVEYRIRTAGGETRRVSEHGRTVSDQAGERVAVDGLIREVTDRRAPDHRGRLDDLVREVATAVVGRETSEEVERVACERLVASDAYEAAWFGAVDARKENVEVCAHAGAGDPPDDADVRLSGEARGGPTGRAVHSGELQVVRAADADPACEPWRERTDGAGYRASAAVPVGHDGTLYGVLHVYTARTGAFDGAERGVAADVGDLVGHAIAAVERKRALMNDEVVELEFRLRDAFEAFDLPGGDGTVRFERAVPLGDGEYLQYGAATPGLCDTVRAMPDRVDDVADVTVLEEDDGRVLFELHRSAPPLRAVVAAGGNRVDECVVEDGDLHVAVQLSPGTEVRQAVETVREAVPDVEFVSQRHRSAPIGSPRRFTGSVLGELTGRQRTVVEAAYYAGFFEWPRETTGEEVADSLDIAAPTFHQHLRKAEVTVFETLLQEVVLSD